MTRKVHLDLHPEEPLPVMDPYRATGLAEGWIDNDGDTELLRAAWQYLEDTGLGYRLQGWFGRQLQVLIAAGEITPRQPKHGL